MGGKNDTASSYTYRTIDLIAEGFTISDIDSGLGSVYFGGWQSGWRTQTDSGKIEIKLKDSSQSLLESVDLAWFYSNLTWTMKRGNTDLLPSTRYIDYGFYSRRFQGSNNDGYLDETFLQLTVIHEPTTILLLGFGLIGLVGFGRKFKKK